MITSPIRIFIDVAGRSFEVRELDGLEAMSRVTRLEARFVLGDELIDPLVPTEVLKTQAVIRLVRDEGTVRSITGLVTRATVGAARAQGSAHAGTKQATVVLESRLSLARHRTDIRVFRDKTAIDIVREVLAYYGIDPELRLSESYLVRPYCVQFRESDLDFVHRLLEDEGVHYFFLADDKLVLGDSPASYEPVLGGPLAFRGGVGLDVADEAFVTLGRKAALVASKVTLRDFNPEKPKLDMEVAAETGVPSGEEWYDYPGEYEDPGEGRRKAAGAAEAFRTNSYAIHGRTTSPRPFPGGTIVALDVPPGVPPGELVVRRVSHAYRRGESGFSVVVEALEAGVTYRPARSTHVPTLMNPLTAFVTGPAGEDIHTDAWGRVKVHFHWDRLQPRDDRCSHWVPVQQDNTGSSCAIPRIGWEVLVHFLEGDPDRPVVLGRVYNPEDTFPETLPMHKTRSALKSMSSPSRDGMNEILLDDSLGAEYIRVHAQRDQNIVVANNRTDITLSNETHAVIRDETIEIATHQTVTVNADTRTDVGGNQTYKVSGNRQRSTGAAESEAVQGNRTLTVGGMHMRKIGTLDQVTAKNLTERVGGVILETSLKNASTTVQQIASVTVGGAIVEVSGSEKSETSKKVRVETVGGMFVSKTAKEYDIRAGKRRQTIAGLLRISAKEDSVVSAVNELTMKLGAGDFEGTTSLTLRVGTSEISMKEGALGISADDTIKVLVKNANKEGAKTSTQI